MGKSQIEMIRDFSLSLLKIYRSLHAYQVSGDMCQCCAKAHVKEIAKSESIDFQFNQYKTHLKLELNTREHVPRKPAEFYSDFSAKRHELLVKRKIRNKGLYLLSKEELTEKFDRGTFQTRERVNSVSFSKVWELAESIGRSKK